MRAGVLDQRVDLLVYTEVQDDIGEPDKVWTTAGNRWAEIVAVVGREGRDTHQTREESDYSVTVRRDSLTAALTPRGRIALGARTFEIVTVLDGGPRRRKVEMLVREVL